MLGTHIGLLRLLIFSYGTVTVTVYGYRYDNRGLRLFLTLVNTVKYRTFCKVTVIYGYRGILLPTVMYGYRGYRGILGILKGK